MYPKKVSIITVCKNSEDTIMYTLNSIKSQTYKHIEHIIIDGNSSDKTKILVKDYIKKEPKIPVIFKSENDNGIYDAINRGIVECTGEIICILNSDDIFHSNTSLEDSMRLISENYEFDIFFFSLTYFNNNNFEKIVRHYPSKSFKKWMLNFGIIPPHPASFIKKEIYSKYGNYNNKYKIAGDFDIFVRFLKIHNLKFKIFDSPIIKMKTGGASGKNLYSYLTSFKENYLSLKNNNQFASMLLIFLKIPNKLLQYFNFDEKKLNKNFVIFKEIVDDAILENKVKLIKNLNDIFKKNFVLSGLNLAFLGYHLNGNIKLYKNLYHWPDGVFSKLLKNRKKIKKIPGRIILSNMQVPKFINRIHVLGVLSEKSRKYLQDKFNLEVISTELPFGDIKIIVEFIPKKIHENELILITLPTPKQEMVAEYIAEKFQNYKVICIGASLAMCSGEEKIVPYLLEKLGLEFLWRLRSDTRRRFIRLSQTFLFFFKGLLNKKLNKIKIEEL